MRGVFDRGREGDRWGLGTTSPQRYDDDITIASLVARDFPVPRLQVMCTHPGVLTVTRKLSEHVVMAVFAVALMLAPLATVAPTAASETGGFHWARNSSQFTLPVGSNLNGSWPGILNQAVADWNRSDTVTFRIVAGGTDPQVCRPVSGRVEVCSSQYGTRTGWLGLTRLYFNKQGDHIDAATVQMNDSFFDTGGQYDNDAARQHTMCHELGHTTGLDHVNTSSCMNDSQSAVFNNLHPINDDFNKLARIYSHDDSTTTIAGSEKKDKKHKKKKKKKKSRKKNPKQNSKSASSQSVETVSPPALPLTSSGVDASETMTIESTEDGRKVVTFITWAEE
jgi:predicted Zn-dependent protease